MKKVIVLLISFFVILGLSFGGYKYYNYYSSEAMKDKLTKIGYSSEEINIVKEHLDFKKIKELYNIEYISNLKESLENCGDDCLDVFDNLIFLKKQELSLKQKGYSEKAIILIKEKLSKDEISELLRRNYYDDLLLILENEEFKNDYFLDYLKGLEEKKDVQKIFLDLNPKVLKLREGKYYLERNVIRYLEYQKKNPNKKDEDVICDVNSNIDSAFYTNMRKTNMDDGYLILVNKYRYLEKSYVPNLVTMKKDYTNSSAKMEKVAYEYFTKMCDEAKKSGLKLYNVSAYRSYDTQNTLYNNYVKNRGKQAADTFSARPGSSEHQTGLAADINTASSSASFEKTKEYVWLSENSYKFGFILRYPLGKEYITGYKFEPWHYRYVGIDAAKVIYENNLTFEEYYAYYIEK